MQTVYFYFDDSELFIKMNRVGIFYMWELCVLQCQ